MSFWRKEVIDFALGQDTELRMQEQKAWIAAEPGNARPYYQLGLLCRMQHQRDAALGLLLHAISLDPELAPAHGALSEMYAASGDLERARHHAARAEALGDPATAEQLRRHAG